MEQSSKLKLNSDALLVFILTVGIFGIINTEMGVIGVSAGMLLGVPVTSYIASEVSFTMGMAFFTVVNVLVFVALRIRIKQSRKQVKLEILS